MRSNAIFGSILTAAMGLTSAACSSDPGADAPQATTTSSSGSGGSSAAPPFSDTTGEAATPRAAYPAAPYGVAIGSVIQNYQFVGYPDAAKEKTTLVPIQLADFYNPHGKDAGYKPPAGGEDDRYFPASSGYAQAGKLKPTVLLIDVASVWCGPCNEEAATVLPVKHTEYAACGGEFLLQLADGPTPGAPATSKHLTSWTTKYKVDYPGVIDPRNKLEPVWVFNAYPQNMIIDTTTMKIVEVIAGEAVTGTCGMASICSADADCAACSGGQCGDGTACTAPADCAQKTCTPYPFWVE